MHSVDPKCTVVEGMRWVVLVVQDRGSAAAQHGWGGENRGAGNWQVLSAGRASGTWLKDAVESRWKPRQASCRLCPASANTVPDRRPHLTHQPLTPTFPSHHPCTLLPPGTHTLPWP